MKHEVKKSFLVSFALHIALITSFVIFGVKVVDRAAGDKEYVVAVEIIGDAEVKSEVDDVILSRQSHPDENQDPKMPDPVRHDRLETKRQATSDRQPATSDQQQTASNRQPTISNQQSAIAYGSPGDGGTNPTLAKIKAKIERAKNYPRLAKRRGLEGRPVVLFEINPDGTIKYVKITRPSGQEIIDNAALETVKRASPLPPYPRPIQLAIKYELK